MQACSSQALPQCVYNGHCAVVRQGCSPPGSLPEATGRPLLRQGTVYHDAGAASSRLAERFTCRLFGPVL